MERKSECQGCGVEMEFNPVDPTPVVEDMMNFINDQEQWSDHPSPTICWGMLMAVFKVVFYLAPNEERAMEVIMDSIDEFLDKESASA